MFPFDTVNFSIFLDNVSAYLIFFNTLSFSFFICTLIYYNKRQPNICTKEPKTIQSEKEPGHVNLTDGESENNDGRESPEVSLSNFKVRRHKEIIRKITSTLSENELEEEKEVERMQLEKIFELLKTQEDKFQMSSVEQVQDQLALYRL